MTESEKPPGIDTLPRSARRGELTRGRPLWTLLKFGTPLVVGMVLHAAFNVVDIYVVSFLSAAAVNAATYGGLLTAIPTILANGVATATVALVSRAAGRGDDAAAAETARQSILLVLILSVVFSVAGAVLAGPLVVFAGAAGKAEVEQATRFMAVSSAGLATVFLLVQVTAILRGLGDGVWPMILLGTCNLLNAVLNFVLVFGCPVPAGSPCPAFARPVLDAVGGIATIAPMGVVGAAWATIVARAAGTAVGVAVLLARRRRAPIPIRAFRPSLTAAWRMLWLGLPNAAQFMVRALSILLLMKAVSPYGQAVRAAVSIGSRYDLLALFFAMGWGAAAASIVGQCLGAGKRARAIRTVWIALALDVGAMAAVGAVYFFRAQGLAEFFPIADPDPVKRMIVREAVLYLRVMAFAYPFVAVAVVVSHAMNGAGEMRLPCWIDTVGLLGIQVPVCFILARLAEVHPAGLLWGTVVLVQAILAAIYLLALRKRGWTRASLE